MEKHMYEMTFVYETANGKIKRISEKFRSNAEELPKRCIFLRDVIVERARKHGAIIVAVFPIQIYELDFVGEIQ